MTESTLRRKKNHPKKNFLKVLPISLIFVLGFLFFTGKEDFLSAFQFLFLTKRNITVYDTFSVSLDEKIPEEFRNTITENLSGIVFEEKERFKFVEKNADISISREKVEGSTEIFSMDMIPVVHFYSLVIDVTEKEIAEMDVYMVNSEYEKYVEEQYGVDATVLESYDALVEKLAEDDENIGLVEFDELDYRVKVLEVDGKYYLDDREGGISLSFYSLLDEDTDEFILSVLRKNVDLNGEAWDESKLSKINMSGVVAIARGLASKMDSLKSTTYPADEIGDFLADADLTHVSNEVSFVPGCRGYTGMVFCSKPEYIDVLKASGVDIVELTGNHNNDYGSKYSAQTIETYKSLGMRYFGGGLDTEDASKILYEEINGTKIAFLGYNYYDTVYKSLALAGEDRSGANSYSVEKIEENIKEARENDADIVILTFQFQECYSYPDSDVIYRICYKPLSSPDQRGVFKEAIDLGADIVVGTQAHQPQTYELYKDGVIFYGLGNLFFDQSIWIGTRQGLVLSHYFYNGKHIQTRVVPIYMEKDLKPRLATDAQGDLLLELLKEARD